MTSPPDVESPDPQRLVVLGDLHLSVGIARPPAPHEPPEAFFHDATLVRLIEQLLDDPEPVDSLLLLGDTFELPGGIARGRLRGRFLELTPEELVGRLDRIATAHRDVFAALGRYMGRGGWIHLVPGNHDPGLHHPLVAARLRVLLSDEAGSTEASDRVTIHPWIFHVPGLLYAEHGHQYHAINAFLAPEHPWVESSDDGLVWLEDPIGSALHRAYVAYGRTRLSMARGSLAVLRSVLVNSWAQLTSPSGSASAVGVLPAATTTAIRAASRVTPWSTSSAIASKLLKRLGLRRGSKQEPHYLHRAAMVVHRHLAAAEVAVPTYVFGHSHRPERVLLGDDRSSVGYLNPGSWAQWQTPRERCESLPYATVWFDEANEPRSDLRWWPTITE